MRSRWGLTPAATQSVGSGQRNPAWDGQAHARCRALNHDLPAEAEALSGAPARAALPLSGALDQPTLLHQAPKVLLVERHARESLDALLKLQEREARRHQLEYHRPILELAAEPTHGRRKDPAMIHRHGLAEHRRGGIGQSPAVAPRFQDKSRLVEQLVALEYAFLVPARRCQAKGC